MSDFVSNNTEVSINEMLDFVANNMGQVPVGTDGDDTDNKGKLTCGVEAAALFTGFSIGDPNGIFPNYKKYDELYKSMFADGWTSGTDGDPPNLDNDSSFLASGDFDKIVEYNKYWSGDFKVVNDNMIPEDVDDRVTGAVYNIDKSMNNNDAMRPIAQKGPIWMVGEGQNQKGQSLGQEKVGLLDLYYDETAQMWRATQEFPAVGRVIDDTTINPYTVEIYGTSVATPSGESSVVPSGSSLVSSKRTILNNVYYLYDSAITPQPSLASGDVVNITVDYPNGKYVCTKSAPARGVSFGVVDSPPLAGLANVVFYKVNDDGTKTSLGTSASGVIPEE